jgi:MFS family permease
VVSMGVGFARPGFTAGASLAVGPGEQGAVAGLMMSIAGISYLVPPVIGVALYQLVGFGPFAANAVLLALAFFVCLTSAALRAAAVSTGVGAEVASEPPASQPGPEGNR